MEERDNDHGEKPFENIVGNGENARNHFLVLSPLAEGQQDYFYHVVYLCPLVCKLFIHRSPLKVMNDFQPNFTGVFLW